MLKKWRVETFMQGKIAAKGGAIAATIFWVEAGSNELAGGGGGVKGKRKKSLGSNGSTFKAQKTYTKEEKICFKYNRMLD